MIPLRVLRGVRRILTHEGCPDGAASAMILHHCLPDAEVVFCQYGSAALADLRPQQGDLFCDFSPPRNRAEEWLEFPETVVLDHHATAKDVVRRFQYGVYGEAPGVSGAMLAYQEVWAHLWPDTVTEPHEERILRILNVVIRFACLAGIRDTWQTGDPLWSESCEQAEALRFWPAQYLLSRQPGQWEEAMRIGKILVQKNQDRDRRFVERAYRLGSALVISSTAIEDVAEYLKLTDPTVHIVVGFNYFSEEGTLKLRVSLRSHVVDVSAIAARFGGGGHKNAAGFVIPAPAGQNPYEFLSEAIKYS